MTITVYSAKKIITMDRNLPEATHVAVKDGRILAVGDAELAGKIREFRQRERELILSVS